MRYVLVYTDEDGYWSADVPSLPGCGSDGKTREEALERVKEAIELYLTDLPEERKELCQEYINPELVGVEIAGE